MSLAELAVLVDDAQAHTTPSTVQVETFLQERSANFLAQQTETALHEQTKKLQMAERYAGLIEQKRAEKQLKKGKGKAVELGTDPEALQSFELLVPDLPPASLAPPSASSLSNPPRAPLSAETIAGTTYHISIPTSSVSLPWYTPSNLAHIYPTLEAAREAGLFTYPNTKLQEVKCKIFEDLWSRGFYMGGGLKFGGDFLIYPGKILPLDE